jgi:hypothetical protein
MTESPELTEVDHNAHFRALSDLADLLDGWVTQWAEEADKAAQSKPKHEHQEDAVISVYQHVGFVEMARGHALVSSITAFCESLFKNQLPLLRWSFKGNLPSEHPRVAQFASSPASFWDSSKGGEQDGGLPRWVVTILSLGGFIDLFGVDFEKTLYAVFAYRNAMVHNGYEWPEDERERFAAKVAGNNWTEWFNCSTSGDKPWYYYTTPLFRKTCLNLCQRSVAAFDAIILGDSDRLTALDNTSKNKKRRLI